MAHRLQSRFRLRFPPISEGSPLPLGIAHDKFSYHARMKCIFLLLWGISTALAQSFVGAADADAAIQQAIQDKKIPGAVLVVGHRGKVIYRKAYGKQALLPAEEPMSINTIFDIASLTKVV